MNYALRRAEGVVIVDLSSNPSLRGGDVVLRRLIRELLDHGERKITLNMNQVDHMDNAVIGELVAAHVCAGNKGGEIALLNLTPTIHSLLQFTRFISLFKCFDAEADALAHFCGD